MGYPKGTQIAKKAAASGQNVKEIVLEEGLMSEDEAKTLLDPMTITDWHQSQPIIGHPQEA